jgi:hypothetical protein
MAPEVNPGLSTDGQIPGLSIRDMISLATRQLSASSRPTDTGYTIDLRDYQNNLSTHIELSRSDQGLGSNLKISVKRIKGDNDQVSVVSQLNIEHLYVTWETKGMISFCYAGDGRFKLINVTNSNGVVVLEDIDRRAKAKPDEELSESQRRAQSKRRTFYHIGTLFDNVTPHDPTEPLLGSAEDEADDS